MKINRNRNKYLQCLKIQDYLYETGFSFPSISLAKFGACKIIIRTEQAEAKTKFNLASEFVRKYASKG